MQEECSIVPYNHLQNELRGRARELIRRGLLPRERPLHMWGGYGCDLACALCEQIILQNEVEYELEYRTPAGARHYRFHFLCHAAWQLECAHEETLNKASP